MRWKAPEHITSINLIAGKCEVRNGFIEAPDDLSQGDLAGLAAHGFQPAPAAEPGQPKAALKAPEA